MRKRRILKGLILLLLALLVIGAGALALWNVKLTEITVIGSSCYSDDELIAQVFPEAKYFRTAYMLWNVRFGEEEEIPFVKSYDLTITGPHSAQIVVYEKNIIGYIPYMGNYLYFDTDGYIVETSTEKVDGLLFIDGIYFDYFVLNNQLPVTDSKIFSQILVLSQLVQQEELDLERVYFDKSLNITLYTGQISVYLGQGTDLESKLHTLKDILPQLADQQGTLYLDNYSTVNNTVEYIFKREDTTEE
jgi:cell division protein FtsQ